MHDLHIPDKDEKDVAIDTGNFGAGMSTLSKCLKAAFALLIAVIACMAIWKFTFGSIIQVGPQEQVIVLRFGKFAELYPSGWYWVLPYPVNTAVRVPTNNLSIRILDFMPQNRESLTDRNKMQEMMQNPNAALAPGKDGYLITGDANIIHTDWEFTYRIKSPRAYYFKCLTPSTKIEGDDANLTDPRTGAFLGPRGPKTLLRSIFANAVITETSLWKAEDILRPKGGSSYADSVKGRFVKMVADMDIGIDIDNVSLRDRKPPAQAIPAFEDVIIAEQEGAKENEIARAYSIEQAASAEEGRNFLLSDASTYRKRMVSDVVASKMAFDKILKEYKRSPESATVALYTSALSEALEQVKDKFIIRRNGTGSQELRLKLNPEPLSPKNEAKKDSK